MKKINKENVLFVLSIIAFVFFLLLSVVYNVWIEENNKSLKSVTLSDATLNDGVYSFPDFDVKAGVRGGDASAWLKDPILDDDGNELHGASVGIIYEMVITNTSPAQINSWTMDVYMPEFMWINNGWNGDFELHQTNDDGVRVQTIDLGEYSSIEFQLDYYIDHTGPMIPLYEGDKFVYHPSKANNEFPLDPESLTEDVNSKVIIGFIVYVPDKGLDYAPVFENIEFKYYLNKSVWSEPLFITFICLGAISLVLIIAQIMSNLKVRTLLKQQEKDAIIIEHSINTLINFVEAKDPNTKGHSERVSNIAYALACEMNYSPRDCHDIRCIALMHDCGKIAIPVSILQKPDKLTKEEYEEIKRHTTVGGEMLRDFTSIKDMSVGALYHHERYDGMGYPKGLKGEEIPFISRIICVADSLDAMNSNRCYRPRLTAEQIMDELIKNKGKQFDPVVIEHLLKIIERGEIVLGEQKTDE